MKNFNPCTPNNLPQRRIKKEVRKGMKIIKINIYWCNSKESPTQVSQAPNTKMKTINKSVNTGSDKDIKIVVSKSNSRRINVLIFTNLVNAKLNITSKEKSIYAYNIKNASIKANNPVASTNEKPRIA